jgi:hypothetical protein
MMKGFIVAEAAGSMSGGMAAAPAILFSFSALIVTAVLISPEIVGRTCEFCAGLLSGIIFPDDKFSKPPLSYLLARRYRDQLRPHEAVEQYKKIIHYYPRERDAYVELLAVAKSVGDERTCRKYGRIFKRRFDEELKAALPSADPAKTSG